MKFTDKHSHNQKPDDFFVSRIVEVDNLPNDKKHEIKSNVPIEVKVNNGEWVLIDPSDL